jgi:hypothetical protein
MYAKKYQGQLSISTDSANTYLFQSPMHTFINTIMHMNVWLQHTKDNLPLNKIYKPEANIHKKHHIIINTNCRERKYLFQVLISQS